MRFTTKNTPIPFLLSIILSSLYIGSLSAVEVKGVKIAEKVTQTESKQTLILNGTGMRSKFIFNIYIGALYLPQKTTDPKQVINSADAKRVAMHFLYDKVEKKKMTDGWSDGFSDALDKASMQSMQARIDQFNSFFPDMVEGDTVIIDFIPAQGTVVMINNNLKGTIAGADFQKALLTIWFGDSPPNEELKDGMLGIVD